MARKRRGKAQKRQFKYESNQRLCNLWLCRGKPEARQRKARKRQGKERQGKGRHFKGNLERVRQLVEGGANIEELDD
jgi:hypothetical protein